MYWIYWVMEVGILYKFIKWYKFDSVLNVESKLEVW